MNETFENMDRMYRLQRYFYDATRKYYLLGRDRLLTELDVKPNEQVLEIGCGTARNLIILARRRPDATLFGLDASMAMLKTARRKINNAKAANVTLKTGLANDLSFDATFGLGCAFDKIFFSYSISMIPCWQEAIDRALANLKPGGQLFIVDFYDQEQFPVMFRKTLTWWLNKFHVTYWQGLIPYVRSLESTGSAKVWITPLFRRYSFLLQIRKQ
jgi:S-adenosylmethionine-diacylgycerolhomoserine-N-methlytransferase